MDQAIGTSSVTKRDLARNRRLAAAAVGAPVAGLVVPLALTLLITFIFGMSPPAAVTIFFFGIIITAILTLAGLGLSGFFLYRRSQWTAELRERIARNGISATDVDWFRKEMRSGERRVLDRLRRTDPLLADNYADALASRITATRIFASSRRELSLMQRRRNKLKMLKTENSAAFRRQIESDIDKVASIRDEAYLLRSEAESRLQMLEAADARGSMLAESEVALKKLSLRAQGLPLELEQAKMADEIRKELEAEEETGE